MQGRGNLILAGKKVVGKKTISEMLCHMTNKVMVDLCVEKEEPFEDICEKIRMAFKTIMNQNKSVIFKVNLENIRNPKILSLFAEIIEYSDYTLIDIDPKDLENAAKHSTGINEDTPEDELIESGLKLIRNNHHF